MAYGHINYAQSAQELWPASSTSFAAQIASIRNKLCVCCFLQLSVHCMRCAEDEVLLLNRMRHKLYKMFRIFYRCALCATLARRRRCALWQAVLLLLRFFIVRQLILLPHSCSPPMWQAICDALTRCIHMSYVYVGFIRFFFASFFLAHFIFRF